MRNRREGYSLHGHCGQRGISLEAFFPQKCFSQETGVFSDLLICILIKLSPGLAWLLRGKGEQFWFWALAILGSCYMDFTQKSGTEFSPGKGWKRKR